MIFRPYGDSVAKVALLWKRHACHVTPLGPLLLIFFQKSQTSGGLEHFSYIFPDEPSGLSRECRDAWLSLGSAHYDLKGAEQGNLSIRRSLYAVADIEDGEVLSLPVRAGVAVSRQRSQ